MLLDKLNSHQRMLPIKNYLAINTVKKFIKSKTDKRLFVRTKFLDNLNAEIDRILVKSIEATESKRLSVLAVTVSSKEVKEQFLCRRYVVERIQTLRQGLSVSKSFYVALNGYIANVILMSLESIQTANLVDIANGTTDERILIKEKAVKQNNEFSPLVSIPELAPLVIPTTRRVSNVIDYILQTQGQKLNGQLTINASRTAAQLKRLCEHIIGNHLDAMGIKETATLEIVSIKKQ